MEEENNQSKNKISKKKIIFVCVVVVTIIFLLLGTQIYKSLKYNFSDTTQALITQIKDDELNTPGMFYFSFEDSGKDYILIGYEILYCKKSESGIKVTKTYYENENLIIDLDVTDVYNTDYDGMVFVLAPFEKYYEIIQTTQEYNNVYINVHDVLEDTYDEKQELSEYTLNQ